MARQNTAYDLSLFEPAKKEQVSKKEPLRVIKTNTKTQPKMNALVRGSIICLVLIAVLSIIITQVALTEVTMKITKANGEYSEAMSENVRLNSQMASMMSVKNVEKVATQQLGLTKIDESQIEYVTLQSENKGQISKKNRNLWEKIKLGFSEFKAYIGETFNNN